MQRADVASDGLHRRQSPVLAAITDLDGEGRAVHRAHVLPDERQLAAVYGARRKARDLLRRGIVHGVAPAARRTGVARRVIGCRPDLQSAVVIDGRIQAQRKAVRG